MFSTVSWTVKSECCREVSSCIITSCNWIVGWNRGPAVNDPNVLSDSSWFNVLNEIHCDLTGCLRRKRGSFWMDSCFQLSISSAMQRQMEEKSFPLSSSDVSERRTSPTWFVCSNPERRGVSHNICLHLSSDITEHRFSVFNWNKLTDHHFCLNIWVFICFPGKQTLNLLFCKVCFGCNRRFWSFWNQKF